MAPIKYYVCRICLGSGAPRDHPRLDSGVDSRVHSRAMDSREDAPTVFRIGELAAVTKLTPDTLRYYERVGLLEAPKRSAGGFRLFGPEAVERVRLVKQAQALGLELRDIRQLIGAHGARGATQCREVQPVLQTRLAELDTRLRELRGLRRTLKRALDRCEERLASQLEAACPVVEELERAARPTTARRTKAPVHVQRRTRSAG